MKAQATPAADTSRQDSIVHLKITPALVAKIQEGVKETGLTKSALSRLALERGLDIVLAQLNGDTTPAPKHAA